MARPLLPPKGIFTATRWLFDARLAPGIKETLLQIMALTWGSPCCATPPLSYQQLEALTGKDARTLRGHFSALRTYHAALRLQRAGAGQFIIVLAEWLYSNRVELPDPSQTGEILPQPDQEEEEEISIPDLDESLLPPDNPSARRKKTAPPPEQTAGAERSAAQKENGSAADDAISKAMRKRLQTAGVFPVLMDEVGKLVVRWKYSERELKALLEWCKDDQPDRPAALFMGRIRAGGRAPAIYATPPCRRCGLRGRHAPDCPGRYTAM